MFNFWSQFWFCHFIFARVDTCRSPGCDELPLQAKTSSLRRRDRWCTNKTWDCHAKFHGGAFRPHAVTREATGGGTAKRWYRTVIERIRTCSTIKIRTSNVHSPLQLGSDRRETSGKRVSDDLQLSIFRRRKNFFEIFFEKISGFSWFSNDFGLIFEFLTSPAASTSNFASDTPFLRSVRPKIDEFWPNSDRKSEKFL